MLSHELLSDKPLISCNAVREVEDRNAIEQRETLELTSGFELSFEPSTKSSEENKSKWWTDSRKLEEEMLFLTTHHIRFLQYF